MTCTVDRGDIAAHVLGLLPPDDDARVRAHLATCPPCAAIGAELAAAADALAGARGAPADVPPPPAEAVLGRIAQTRRRERRTLGLARGLAGVALVLALGATAVAGWALARPVDDFAPAGGTQLVLEATDDAQAAGVVTLTARGWGTQLDIRTERLPALAPGGIYEVWLETADGARVCAGTFRLPNEAGRARVRLAAGTELASLTAIELAPQGASTPVLQAAVART